MNRKAAEAFQKDYDDAVNAGSAQVDELHERLQSANQKWDDVEIDLIKEKSEINRVLTSASKFHPNLNLKQFGHMPDRLTIEIEQCCNCHEHAYCTHHDERKYWYYTLKFMRAIKHTICELFEKPEDWAKIDVVVNPGPRSRGMHCKPMQYSTTLWKAMVEDHVTLKLKKNFLKKIFGYEARCEFWLKLRFRFWIW